MRRIFICDYYALCRCFLFPLVVWFACFASLKSLVARLTVRFPCAETPSHRGPLRRRRNLAKGNKSSAHGHEKGKERSRAHTSPTHTRLTHGSGSEQKQTAAVLQHAPPTLEPGPSGRTLAAAAAASAPPLLSAPPPAAALHHRSRLSAFQLASRSEPRRHTTSTHTQRRTPTHFGSNPLARLVRIRLRRWFASFRVRPDRSAVPRCARSWPRLRRRRAEELK